jgi:hypothetical protein
MRKARLIVGVLSRTRSELHADPLGLPYPETSVARPSFEACMVVRTQAERLDVEAALGVLLDGSNDNVRAIPVDQVGAEWRYRT